MIVMMDFCAQIAQQWALQSNNPVVLVFSHSVVTIMKQFDVPTAFQDMERSLRLMSRMMESYTAE